MGYNIIIYTEAEEDTRKDYIFYEDQLTCLEDRFLNELEAFYKKLADHPTYYSFISEEKTTRSIALKKFPYSIIYEIESSDVYVFAIHHFSQNPNHFLKRL